MTTTLSLDATVVLLTPVVLTAAAAAGVSARPGAHACLRMANSASLLLPVSNLTNLLAMRYVGLTFVGFASAMAPVLAVVLVIEYVAARLLFRRELTEEADPAHVVPDRPPVPRLPLVTVGAMLVGFAVASPLGVEPFWVSGAAAVVLFGVGRSPGPRHPGPGRARRPPGVRDLRALPGDRGRRPGGRAPRRPGPRPAAGRDVVRRPPADRALATLLANLLTNLSATLLLVPMLAPLGTTAVLAALLGLNIGSGLTYTGSLANLLWRRTLVRHGRRPTMSGVPPRLTAGDAGQPAGSGHGAERWSATDRAGSLGSGHEQPEPP